MKNYGDAECHYDIRDGVVYFSERGHEEVVARFDSDLKAEAYLDKKYSGSNTNRKTKKTSGKYEQKKKKQHK